MINGFTREEIKNSVEYQWRTHQAKSLFIVFGIICVPSLFMTFFYAMANPDYLLVVFLSSAGCLVFFLVSFSSIALFYFLKARYFLKNYKSFDAYEVVLERVSTSWNYRGCIYYSVDIKGPNFNKSVDTNPYFSSGFLSKFLPEDYNNRTVIGLYDENQNKFYIVRKK